jgi:CheY-like chemotaxis protein
MVWEILAMGSLLSFGEPPVINLIPTSSDQPELPHERRIKRERALRAKKHGNRVLIVGRQRELALYRAEFLRQAGFTVLTAPDVEDAIRMLQGAAYDALVLSYTLPSGDVQYLAAAARDYCAECAIVVISNRSTLDQPVKADAVVMAEEGPTGLVSALKQVLDES